MTNTCDVGWPAWFSDQQKIMLIPKVMKTSQVRANATNLRARVLQGFVWKDSWRTSQETAISFLENGHPFLDVRLILLEPQKEPQLAGALLCELNCKKRSLLVLMKPVWLCLRIRMILLHHQRYRLKLATRDEDKASSTPYRQVTCTLRGDPPMKIIEDARV